MGKMRQSSNPKPLPITGISLPWEEKAALEMYFRLCRTGTDRDTAYEKVSDFFGAGVASKAVPWKR